MERRCRARAAYYTLITVDGYLKGCGATLQIAVHDLRKAPSQPYVAYWHGEGTADDLAIVQVQQKKKENKKETQQAKPAWRH